MMLLLVPYTNSSAQSADKNYIQTKTYLDENASSFLRHIDYYDELGFVSETVDVGMNTSGTPIVTKTEYNSHVKPIEEWLPIPSTSLDYIGDVENAARSTYNDVDAYKWNWYDDFDRTTHTWKPGEDWDGHPAHITYNAVPAGVVKRYSVSDNGTLGENGTYPYGLLTCTTTTDEDGRTMTVFTNLHEETILERRGTGNDTYYVYDKFGRLCYVLPPMCQQCSSTDMQKYWYKYTYDDRGRCIEKQLPGCTEVKYWYDDADRILSMQDNILLETSYYRNYAYDAIGRMTLQTLSRSQGEANLSNAEIVEVRNFYDRNSFISEMTNLFPEWADSINAYQIESRIARGKLLATLQTTSNENYFLEMFSYDAKGRMTYRLGAYTDLWMKIDRKSYNFIGDVTNIEEHIYNHDRTISHLAGRRTSQSYKSGTRLPAITTLTCIDRSGNHTASRINNLTYDDFGRVVGNDRPGQYADITYTYDNLHGWLSGISSPCGFSELLKRETAATPQYGGNIGTAIWRSTLNGEQHRYDFTYDALGRLTYSQYSSSVNANSGHFNESVEYNCQGTITSLLRYGMKNNGTFGIIDDLSISYDGNRLLSVTDDADPVNYNGALDFNDGADLSVEYEYNAVGALVRDSNRGINGINYDFCQYPKVINMGNNMREISYDYTPDGRKLYCRHTTRIAGVSSNTMNTITDTYIDGLILRDGSPLMWQYDGGYVALNASAVPTSWNFYVSDHLGSTRMVVTSTNTIKEAINYYPYGCEMRMTDPAQIANTSNKERFRFSGKELDFQNGLNMYDFGARMFDVAGVPVWTSVDPLAEDNRHVTPYSYCNGDPVNRFDPDGRDWYKNDYGNLYWNPEVRSQSNLQDGCTYVGPQFFDQERMIEYRDDGTIKYLTESEAISRMLLQKHHSTSKSNPTGKEQSAFILSDGSVLVMPDNWNNSFKSYFDKTGYSRQNHILTDSKGRNYSYVGHIHTHPLGADKGINEYSEDAWFAKADKDITMFILHADNNIYEAYYSSKRGGLDTNFEPFSRNIVMKGKGVLLKKALKNKNR